MSLNPFEIRLELLKLAQNSTAERIHSARQALMDKYFGEKENNPNTAFPNLPNLPTTEDVINEAKKLNDFVSNN